MHLRRVQAAGQLDGASITPLQHLDPAFHDASFRNSTIGASAQADGPWAGFVTVLAHAQWSLTGHCQPMLRHHNIP
jgi:hypothetical protein